MGASSNSDEWLCAEVGICFFEIKIFRDILKVSNAACGVLTGGHILMLLFSEAKKLSKIPRLACEIVVDKTARQGLL